MPELPEVETIRTQIEQSVVGLHITNVTFPDRQSKILKGEIERVIGQTIIAARRFGKLLIIDLSDKYSLAIHLKMTGRLYLLDPDKKHPPHTHLIFTLQNKLLTFSDARRFGYVQIMLTEEVTKLPFIIRLGKEPLKDLKLSDFEQLLRKSKRPIKTLLLDQQRIAGIGNIYACESLWMAQIDPHTPASSLQKKQIQELFTAIEDVLAEGIARGGASDNSYRNLMGGKGKYQNFFKVYGRTGKPCMRCGNPIERITLGGRGTFFCPHCQA